MTFYRHAKIMLNSMLLCGACSVAFSANAAFMNMAMDNGQSAVNIAANAALNSALCNSTNTCGGGRSAEEKAQRKAESEAYLECKREVINSTVSGTPQRKAGYARCDAMRTSGQLSGTTAHTNMTAQNNADWSYSVSTALSKKVKDDVVKAANRNMKLSNPSKFNAMIYNNDVEQLYADLMSAQGLRGGNLADATTGYWLTMWTIVHQAPMPSRTEAQAVRKQMQAALSSTPAAKGGDAEKQRLSQMMMWSVMISLAAYRKPDMNRAELARVTNENAKRQGFDLAKIKITRTGFAQ